MPSGAVGCIEPDDCGTTASPVTVSPRSRVNAVPGKRALGHGSAARARAQGLVAHTRRPSAPGPPAPHKTPAVHAQMRPVAFDGRRNRHDTRIHRRGRPRTRRRPRRPPASRPGSGRARPRSLVHAGDEEVPRSPGGEPRGRRAKREPLPARRRRRHGAHVGDLRPARVGVVVDRPAIRVRPGEQVAFGSSMNVGICPVSSASPSGTRSTAAAPRCTYLIGSVSLPTVHRIADRDHAVALARGRKGAVGDGGKRAVVDRHVEAIATARARHGEQIAVAVGAEIEDERCRRRRWCPGLSATSATRAAWSARRSDRAPSSCRT